MNVRELAKIAIWLDRHISRELWPTAVKIATDDEREQETILAMLLAHGRKNV